MVRVTGPYDIDAVRSEWIGRETAVVRGRYPVEYDAIRRHCHRVEEQRVGVLDHVAVPTDRVVLDRVAPAHDGGLATDPVGADAVDRLYRRAVFHSERERVEHLLARYERIVAPLDAARPKPRRRRRRT